MTASVPSWLANTLAQQIQHFNDQVLPHGLLFIAPDELPMDGFYQPLIARILCRVTGPSACGHCKDCQLYHSGHHPDVHQVEPEGKGDQIKVDQIRQVIAQAAETAQQGGRRVIFIQRSQRMNVNAANALLKLLEEPNADTFILLQCEKISELLPTLRSRCRILPLPTASQKEALAYVLANNNQVDAKVALEICANNAFQASQLAKEQVDQWYQLEKMFSGHAGFVELSENLEKSDLEGSIQQVLLWVDSAIRRQSGQEIALASVSEPLLKSLQVIDSKRLFSFRDYLLKQLTAVRSPSNLNGRLIAEATAMRWLELRGQS